MRTIAFIACFFMTVTLCYGHSARLQSARLRKLAIICDGRQRADLVLAASEKGLIVNPFNMVLHGYAAQALMNLKRYKDAIYHTERMLEYYPNDLNSLFRGVYAYYNQGDMKKARALRDRIERIQPRYVKKR